MFGVKVKASHKIRRYNKIVNVRTEVFFMYGIVEKRKQNWVDFYNMNTSTNRLLVVEYTQDVLQRPPLWWEYLPQREEWAYRRYMMQMENMSHLPDNTVPHLSMITGTEIFAEAFGCNVHKPEKDNPFAMPLIRDVSEWSKIKMPRLEDTNLVKLFDMADRLKARAGRDALLSLPDIQTPVDVAALIWEKSDFYASMFEEEPAIRELTAMVKELIFAFLDEWFRRYGPAGMAHYPDYYMPYGVTVSEDEIGIVSSEMYKAYFRDELHEFGERYGAIGIHCCADSNHQWKNLVQVPHLKVLNFVRDADNTRKAVEYFGPTTPMFNNTMVDLRTIPGSEAFHVADFVYANSLENAIEIAKRWNQENQI